MALKSYQAMTMPTYTAVDAIALGCMLALLWRSSTVEKRRPLLRLALIVGGTLAVMRLLLFIFPVWENESLVRVLNTLPFALACMWLIDKGARDELPAWLGNRWLAKLGLVSYAVYVVHRFVMHFMGYDYERGLRVFFPVLAVSTLIAIVSWIVYEGPINNLKRFFPYVKRGEPTPTSVPSIVEA